MIGRQVTFSGKRNRRIFKPNLHAYWIAESGKNMRKKFCTKCLRLVKGKTVTRAVKSGGRRVGAVQTAS
ncbi:MAG: mitochondrial large ribosomal subunit protein bL28m [Candidatus Blackburnbacteria bacterium]|nr:mitochondrial large ribosomal subunit protein bL28m [Candidatus Blackburnbacteria bacterium]